MLHCATVRIRLDYGTDGLEVDLPDERITVDVFVGKQLPVRQ